MAAKIFYFSGPVKWAKVYDHNVDEYGGTEFASIDVYLDEENQKRFKESESRLKVREDEDGVFVKFRRNIENRVNPDWGGTPVVLDAEGEPFNELIGNGSECTVKVTVYDTKMGKGTRLERVRVDKHVAYEKPEASEVEEGTTEGIPF